MFDLFSPRMELSGVRPYNCTLQILRFLAYAVIVVGYFWLSMGTYLWWMEDEYAATAAAFFTGIAAIILGGIASYIVDYYSKKSSNSDVLNKFMIENQYIIEALYKKAKELIENKVVSNALSVTVFILVTTYMLGLSRGKTKK